MHFPWLVLLLSLLFFLFYDESYFRRYYWDSRRRRPNSDLAWYFYPFSNSYISEPVATALSGCVNATEFSFTCGAMHSPFCTFPTTILCPLIRINCRHSTRARFPLYLRTQHAPLYFFLIARFMRTADHRVIASPHQTRRPDIHSTVLYHDPFNDGVCSREAYLNVAGWRDWQRRKTDIVSFCNSCQKNLNRNEETVAHLQVLLKAYLYDGI